MPHDPTEYARRQMLPDMPTECINAYQRGESVWNTADMREEFEVLGFQAPFVVVKRKADGVKGSLKFTHSPRWYFGWQPDTRFATEIDKER